MQDRPTSVELLEAAADFVDRELVPTMRARASFRTSCRQRDANRRAKSNWKIHWFVAKSSSARLLGTTPHLHSLDDLRKAATSMGED